MGFRDLGVKGVREGGGWQAVKRCGEIDDLGRQVRCRGCSVLV